MRRSGVWLLALRRHVSASTGAVALLEDEEVLLGLLNSAPVVEACPTEELGGDGGRAFASGFGGSGSDAELVELRRVRGAL